MTDLLTDLGKIAGVLAFLGYIPYLLSIVKRKTLPNPATWWIWTIMGGILFASYYLEGNREAIWVPLSYFIGPTVTAILSLKYGRNEFGNFEKYCLGGAAMSLVLWQISGPVVARTMLIMIDLIAIAPTLRKTYFKPDSEDPLAWSIIWLANTLNLSVVVASESPTYAAIAYPLELFFIPTSIMILVIRGKIVGLPGAKEQRLQKAYAATTPTPQYASPPVPPASAPASAPATAFKSPDISEPFDASLNQLIRQGARQIISQAVTAELNELLTQKGIPHNNEYRTNSAKSDKPRNTPSHAEEYHPTENVSLNSEKDTSTIVSHSSTTTQPNTKIASQLPPYLENSNSPKAILPWLCLKGISQEDLNDQLSKLLSAEVEPLSAAAVVQMQTAWNEEYQAWQQRPLANQRYVYIWADGISLERSNETYPHLLVIAGVRADGYIELLGLEVGDSSSEATWKSLLLQLKSQGLNYSPRLAVGSSNLGLWKALTEVFPATQQQECWNRKTLSILEQLPTKLRSKVSKALWEIYRAETQADAKEALEQFVETYQTKYPEATECLTKHEEVLLTFYSFPAEHWQSLRNNSLIDLVFATLRMDTVDPLGEPLNQAAGQATIQALLPAAFKLTQNAAKQWQRIRGVKYLGDVIEGIPFADGIRTEKAIESPMDEPAAA